MTVETKLVRYADDSRLQIYKYYEIKNNTGSESQGPKVINVVFIHGGAWRDPNNTCEDFDKIVEYWDGFNETQKSIKVYSIDYRLSQENGGPFPGSLHDVLKALNEIKKTFGTNNDDIIMIGHSVGCTFMTQILEYKDILKKLGQEKEASSYDIPTIRKVVFMDGIYNIKEMLNEYPAYDFFVKEEFETVENGIKFCNSVGTSSFPERYNDIEQIIILHSNQDELLSLKQPKKFIEWLENNNINVDKVIYGDFGEHNNVYQCEKVASLVYTNVLT